jgi:hypothetical protein
MKTDPATTLTIKAGSSMAAFTCLENARISRIARSDSAPSRPPQASAENIPQLPHTGK